MTLYAFFDYTVPDPKPITGWFDTEAHDYVLPDFRNLLEVTQEQWDGRFPNPSDWAVEAGALIPYVAPVPLPVQAQLLLSAKLTAGVALTSASLPAVNATYSLDGISTAQIFQIGSFANSFGVFPSGGSLQPYPDVDSLAHLFDVPVFIAFLRAVAALVSDLQTQTSIFANGGTPNWPDQTASII